MTDKINQNQSEKVDQSADQPNIIACRFTPWDKVFYFDGRDLDLKPKDLIIVKYDSGMEMGRVVEVFKQFTGQIEAEMPLKSVIRKAQKDDIEKINQKNFQKHDQIQICKKFVRQQGLPMVIIDVHNSYDGGRMTFAFIADGRIDFRDLVKQLTNHFHKSVRLHQIGVRDAAKLSGDIGPCGRVLCCRGFLQDLGNVTSETADRQQVSHRGSERLSGMCGRLQCCLAYEQPVYDQLAEKMPPIGSKFKKGDKSGTVKGWHILKQTIDLQLSDGSLIEVKI